MLKIKVNFLEDYEIIALFAKTVQERNDLNTESGFATAATMILIEIINLVAKREKVDVWEDVSETTNGKKIDGKVLKRFNKKVLPAVKDELRRSMRHFPTLAAA